MKKKTKNTKEKKRKSIEEIPQGLTIDDLEGTIDEMNEDEKKTLEEKIDKAKES